MFSGGCGSLSVSTFHEENCRTAASDPLFWRQIWPIIWLSVASHFDRLIIILVNWLRIAEKKKVSLPDLEQGDALEVCSELGEDWREVFNLSRAFEMRERPGMPGPNAN